MVGHHVLFDRYFGGVSCGRQGFEQGCFRMRFYHRCAVGCAGLCGFWRVVMIKTFKPPVRPSIEPKLTESAKLAADMAAFLAAGGQIKKIESGFEFRDPQGRVPVVGSTAYRVLIALYRNALTTPPKLKKGEVRVVNNGDLKQGDIIKGVEWLRTWGWRIEEIRFESSAFIGYRLVR